MEKEIVARKEIDCVVLTLPLHRAGVFTLAKVIISTCLQSIPRIFSRHTVKDAKKTCNGPKNRYVDILPCESNKKKYHCHLVSFVCFFTAPLITLPPWAFPHV